MKTILFRILFLLFSLSLKAMEMPGQWIIYPLPEVGGAYCFQTIDGNVFQPLVWSQEGEVMEWKLVGSPNFAHLSYHPLPLPMEKIQEPKPLVPCLGLNKLENWNEYKKILLYDSKLYKSDINEENIFASDCEKFTDNQSPQVCDKCVALTDTRGFTSTLANVKKRFHPSDTTLDPHVPLMPVGDNKIHPMIKTIKTQISDSLKETCDKSFNILKKNCESEKEKITEERKKLKRKLKKLQKNHPDVPPKASAFEYESVRKVQQVLATDTKIDDDIILDAYLKIVEDITRKVQSLKVNKDPEVSD